MGIKTAASLLLVGLLIALGIGHVAAQDVCGTECAMGPEAAVSFFYEWYLGYIETTGNPLADRAYRDSDYLSASLIAEVDALIEGGAPYDPFLQAQDVPAKITVDSATLHWDTAAVYATQYWGAGPDGFNERLMQIDLALEDSFWKITGIRAGEYAELVHIVDRFLTDYLSHLRFGGLTALDDWYRDRSELSADLIAQIDARLAADPADDPFLMSRDVRADFTIEDVITVSNAASVLVETHWPAMDKEQLLPLTFDLHQDGDGWQITVVSEGENALVSRVVEAFYRQYIDFALQRDNPLVSGAYQVMPYLSDEVVARIDTMIAEGQLFADPILCAQDIPQDFGLRDAEVVGSRAEVTFISLWPRGPNETWEAPGVQVHLTKVDGSWQISEFVCAP